MMLGAIVNVFLAVFFLSSLDLLSKAAGNVATL